MLILLACLLPTLALAAAPEAAPSLESYQAQVGDKALAMLSAIFGSANGIFGGQEDESVNAMMLAFNVAVMAVGAAWFSYNIITATVQGSFDGEFLGRRYSTVWMPIRTVSGAALLVPVWKGWNLAGLAMAFCASVGIGIGNTTWAGLNGEIVPQTTAAPVMKPLREMAAPILTSWLCVANRWVDQTRLKKANVDPAAAEYSVNWSSKPIAGADFVGITYGAQPAANGHNESTCGQVRVEFPALSSSDPGVQAVISVAPNAMASALQGLDSDIAQLLAPVKTIDPDDPDAVIGIESHIREALPRLVAERQQAMDTTIAAVVKGTNATAAARIKELTRQWGWLAAGASPMLATMATIDAHQAKPVVQSTAPATNREPPTIMIFAAMLGGVPQSKSAPADDTCGSWVHDIGSGFFKKCIENPLIAKVKSAGVGSIVGAANSNPLIYSQQLGMTILDLVSGTFGAFLAVIGALGLLALASGPLAPAAGSVVGAGITLFGFLLGLILLPLAMFAIQLVAYIPLMLTIAWIMAVGAWIVVVAESLIAATLWALVHLDPEGEGMGQRTAHGYIFMLNLLFRPSILVFAAFFAQRFCGVLGGFANDVMSGAVAKMMEASSDSLFMVLIMLAAGVWITTVLNIKIVGTAASLMNLIPNQIFTWIGGQFGSDVGSGVATAVSDQAHLSGSQTGSTIAQTATRRSGSKGNGGGGSKGEDKPAPNNTDKALDRANEPPSGRQHVKSSD